MKTVAIIPAKGTSVRLPGKNLRPLLGKPLVAWAIEAAQQSSKIDRIIVSTDDEAIRAIAASYGADAPASVAASTEPIEEVMSRALAWLKSEHDYVPDAIAFLLPTNPLRLSKDLDAMIEQFEQTGADCVAAVCEAKATRNPHWIFTRDASGRVVTSTGHELKDMPRYSQDLPPCYIRNDICFVLRPSNLNDTPPMIWGNTVELYVMDELFDTDINTEEDWFVTEDKLRRLLSKND